MPRQRYVIALGSNKRHHRHGPPQRVIAAALKELTDGGIRVLAASPTLRSAPLGPSRRRYANAAALIAADMGPADLLRALKAIEHRFGRTGGGQRWAARVIDLDIVLWSGGTWASPGLTIPHVSFRNRDFVLRPVLSVTPDWRDPITALTIRQLHTRLTRPRPIPR